MTTGWNRGVAAGLLLALGAARLAGQGGLELLAPIAGAVEVSGEGHYVVMNKGSGKVLTVEGGSVLNLANIEQRALEGSIHQLWWLEYKTSSSGLDYYNVASRRSDKVLEVAGGSEEDGADVLQNRDGNSQRNRWAFIPVADGFFRVVNQNSGKVLEVAGGSLGDGANIQQNSWNGADHQQWRIHPARPAAAPAHDFGQRGFATHAGPVTGGEGGATVTISSAADLLHYMQRPEPHVILVSGTIDLPTSPSRMHNVASNKSILGLGADARIRFGGLNLKSVHNIIIRNIAFTNAADDCINVEEGSTRVWIDHNDFSDGYDGLVDIKRGADFITVSWNRFHNHDKTCLLGHSDSFTSDRGKLRVTYHHNWFTGTVQRHPRVRFGRVHVVNNYYEGAGSYTIGVGVEARVVSDSNYTINANRGFRYYDSSSQPGYIRDTGSVYSGIDNDLDPDRPGGVDWEPADYYAFTPDHVLSVPQLVMSGAGVGVVDPLGPPPPQAYSQWAGAFFTQAELDNPAIGGPPADPDMDGLPNLLEFALAGADPRRPDPGLVSLALASATGDPVLHIQFTLRAGIAAAVVPQLLDFPSGLWLDTPEILSEIASDAGSTTYRASIPVPAGSAALVRLRGSQTTVD
jgi:pectate lyase